ncbi:MAG: sulfite exporter TauE/SafE family protein [Clostridia bacterium]|nr:sulfite exporter TauE/SafE family protein [Clostridia bacterium]
MIIWDIAASFFSGLLGSMGFGGGGILILYLTLVLNSEQVTAQGINLIFFIPCAIMGLILHAKHGLINFKRILPYLLSAIPGVMLGLYLTNTISNAWLGKIFGAILILLGVRELITNFKKI